LNVTAPNPWPVPDAAVEAALHVYKVRLAPFPAHGCTDEKHMRAAILGALPLLGIVELLESAADTIASLEKQCGYGEREGHNIGGECRDAAARMKGEA
jgi:hypothetical protein